MHKALKKQQERTAKRIEYLFFDRSIEVEQLHFSVRWTNLFTQVANKLDEAGCPVELVSSKSETYLKCTSFYMKKWRLKLNREYEDEPLLIIEYASFEPHVYVNDMLPILEKTDLLRHFSKFSGQARFHALTGSDEDMISFIFEVAIKLHETFNK